MRCPFCLGSETKVIDSREANDGDQIRRRRECLVCKERFTTYEFAELSFPRVIKRDNTRETFNEDKLKRGMVKALEKRPVNTEKIESALSRIKRRLRALGEGEVNSEVLGDWMMDELREIDDVAYVRFASVYRSFQDVKAFEEEIKRLHEEKREEETMMGETIQS
ncbi:MAG: transcriptional regulator NrdR [Candidatus Berkiella sp.]